MTEATLQVKRAPSKRKRPLPRLAANVDALPPRRGGSSADQLLDATVELLSENAGFDVSLSDIAKRSGLNSALIKYYFGSKDGLLLAVLERDAKIAMNAMQQLIEMDLPAEEKLRIHISGLINAYFRSPYINRLIHYMFEGGDSAGSRRVAAVFVEPMVRGYTRIIEQGVVAGTMRPIEPALLYYALVGAADHIFHARYAARTTLAQDTITEDVKQRYVETVTGIFLRGLAV